MKTHILFCCVLSVITCCIFTYKAETILGQILGYIALVCSTAAFIKNIIIKIDEGEFDIITTR